MKQSIFWMSVSIPFLCAGFFGFGVNHGDYLVRCEAVRKGLGEYGEINGEPVFQWKVFRNPEKYEVFQTTSSFSPPTQIKVLWR